MTVLLGLVVGICAYASLNHAVVGVRSHRWSTHAPMALFAAFAAAYALLSLLLFDAASVERYQALARWQGALAAGVAAGAYWLASATLGGWSRRALLGLTAGLALVATGSLLFPAGIFYGQVMALERVTSPLGRVSLPVATPNPLQVLANLVFFGPLAFLGLRVVQVYREGRRRMAVVTAMAIVLPAVPALVDTFLLGVETFAFPATEVGLGLGMVFLGVVLSEDVARSAGLKEALQRSRARYRWMVESAPEALGVYDPLGRRFTLFNRGAEALFGRDAAAMESLDPLEDLLAPGHPDPSSAVRKLQRLALEALDGEAPVMEWRVTRPDGSVVPCELRMSPLPSPRGPRVRMSLRDISDRKAEEARQVEIQAQVRRSQVLKTMGTLAEGIAHDFNNILTPIVGLGELAAEELGDHEAAPLVDQMRSSGERARRLVRQILSFSAGHATEPRAFRVQPVVEQAIRFLQAAIPSEVRLAQELGTPEARLWGDPTAIHQVVMNLGLNASHAMGGEGLLTVSLRPVPSGVELEVTDTGTGMDPDTVSRIFDRFFTTKAEGQGTGLGLATVQRIVEEWNGSIEVDTAPGEGASFSVRLPVASGREEEAVEGLALRYGSERILLVDDDPSVITAVTRLLESLGYQVEAHTDPGKAAAAGAASSADACLTDYDMPGMDGIELVERLRGSRPGLPVVLMSGSAAGLGRQPERPGPWKALPKPFERDELSDALRGVLDG